MAVSLADVLSVIGRSDDAIPSQCGGRSAKAHGAAQSAARFAFLQPFFTHPFRDEAHNRFVRRAKFGGGCLRKSGHIARTLDAGHLHAKTNAKEGHIAFTSKFHAGNLAIAAPLAKTARHQYAVHRLQLLDQIDRKSTRLNSSHSCDSSMQTSA